MAPQRFPIRIGRRSAFLLWLVFGVRPDLAWADIGDGRLVICFGRAAFRTEITNLARWRIEGPFLWLTAIGIRMSVRHRDVSFAGSPHGGVRIDLRESVPWGPFKIPAVWVGADDLVAFGAALEALGIPGRDGRKR